MILPAGFLRYDIISRADPSLVFATILASSPQRAWRKFITLHFNALKPRRAAYRVRRQPWTATQEGHP